MSTENTETNDVTIEDNLDDFAADFFGGNSDEPSDNAKSEDDKVAPDVDDDASEEPEDTHSADDGATEDDEDDDSSEENPDETDEDDNESEEGKKPKKVNRFQERINELTAKARQEEREKLELLKRLEALEAKQPKETEEPKPAPKQEQAKTGPQPTDKNEDGTDKYPLGEFDPQFFRDTVEHILSEKEAEQQAKEKQTQQEREALAQRAALQESWDNRLVDVQERYPDYQEKGQELLADLGDIEPAYGQYLTDTLMEMENGPEVFYYLANNPDEAREIVNAGPRKATIALGRLDVKLGGTKPTQVIPKTTKAKTPPPRVKGSAVAKPSVSLDTDDLDAFSRELFKKK